MYVCFSPVGGIIGGFLSFCFIGSQVLKQCMKNDDTSLPHTDEINNAAACMYGA